MPVLPDDNREGVRSMLIRLILLALVLASSTRIARADHYEIIRTTWTDFVKSCEAVFTDLERFKTQREDKIGYRIEQSEDGNAEAINVGSNGKSLAVLGQFKARPGLLLP